jgi:hypothetical protein
VAGHPRKPQGTHLSRRGKRDQPTPLAAWQDSAAAQHPVSRGTTRRASIPIPDAEDSWRPEVQSWFRSLKLSGQASLYEASDWSTAVAAARAYDMSIRTGSPGWFGNFVRLVERLGCTVGDRNRAHIQLDEIGEPQDHDEDAADAQIINWQQRLNAKHDNKDKA